MRSVNRLTILGNVGNDPEVRSTTGGTKVATISVATTETWGQGDAKQEKTEWHRVVLWQNLADIAERYIHKGDRVYIEGRVEYRTWQDKDGNTRYTTECVAKELVMVGSKNRNNSNATAGRNPSRADADDFEDFEDDGFDWQRGEERAPAPPPAAAAKRPAAKKSAAKSSGRGRR